MGEFVLYLIGILWLIGGWYFTRDSRESGGYTYHRSNEDIAWAIYLLLTVFVLMIFALIFKR